jgi:4-amino-4-deoxy-L-arabinose transferase-like glycosyltransferase
MKNSYIFLAPVFIVALFLFGFNLSQAPLFSGELLPAEIAREMLEKNSFSVPQLFYKPYFEKPVLSFWEQILSFKIFGFSEFAVRFLSMSYALGMVLLAFLLGNIQGYGALSALIMATGLGMFLFSKFGGSGIGTAFFISAALSFFFIGYCNRSTYKRKFAFKNKRSSAWFIVTWIMLALGFLRDGPEAVLLPLLIFAVFLFFQNDLKSFIEDAARESIIGVFCFLLIALPWYIWIHFQSRGAFTEEFFSYSGFSFWFYLPSLLLAFLPWSVFVPQAILASLTATDSYAKQREGSSRLLGQFSLIVTLFLLIFLSFSKSKDLEYLPMLLLPLSVLVAKWWSNKFRCERTQPYRNMDALFGIATLAVLSILALYLSLTVFRERFLLISDNACFMPIIIMSFLLISFTCIAMTAILKKPYIAFGFLLSSTVIAYLICMNSMLIPYTKYKDGGIKSFVSKLKPEDKLITYKFNNLSVLFYAQRNILPLNSYDELNEYLRSPEKQEVLGEDLTPISAANKYFIAGLEDMKELAARFEGDDTAVTNLPYEILAETKRYIFAKAL